MLIQSLHVEVVKKKVKFLPLLWHLLMLPKQLHILQAKPHLGRAEKFIILSPLP